MSKGVREAPGKALIGELARESGDRADGAFGEASRCGPVAGAFVPAGVANAAAVTGTIDAEVCFS